MYTTVTPLLEDIIKYYDNTDISNYQNATERKNRILHHLNKASDDLWFFRPWAFTLAATTLTLSGGAVALPSNFARIGDGKITDTNGNPWSEIPHQDMLMLREQGKESTRHWFSISTNLTIPDTTSTRQLVVLYQTIAPVLTVGGNLSPWPQLFSKALLLGTVAKLKMEEGAKGSWEQDYLIAKSQLAKTAMPMRSRQQQMPYSTGGGMW